MIWIWQGVKLGELSPPTLKEMRLVKRDLGIRNPMTFLARATAIMEPVPQFGPDGSPLLDAEGKQVVKLQPGEQFDFECFAMLIAILKTRQGEPTEWEDVDGDISRDLRVEMTAAERAKAAEAAGKAGASAAEVARVLGPTGSGTASRTGRSSSARTRAVSGSRSA